MELEEELPKVLKNNTNLVPVIMGFVALGVGLGVGYILGRRKKPYEVIRLGDRMPEERPPRVVISEDDHPKFNKEVAYATTPLTTVRTEVTPDVSVTVNGESVETVRANLFADTEEDEDHWDYDEEIKKRNPLRPYVIHRDEFFAEEMATENYLQSTLVYYAGDNIMVDEEEKPIYNHTDVVGNELKFGHGSGDRNTVYIRNMPRSAEYEVLYDPGMYSVEVLGLEIENNERAKDLKHSKERKFRPE